MPDIRFDKYYRYNELTRLLPPPAWVSSLELTRAAVLKEGQTAGADVIDKGAKGVRDYFGSRGYINTRVKMGQSSNVVAVAMMGDGKVLFAQKEIKVTLGGCGG